MPLAVCSKAAQYLRFYTIKPVSSSIAALHTSDVSSLRDTRIQHNSVKRLKTALSSPSNIRSGQKLYISFATTNREYKLSSNTTINRSINCLQCKRNSTYAFVFPLDNCFPKSYLVRHKKYVTRKNNKIPNLHNVHIRIPWMNIWQIASHSGLHEQAVYKITVFSISMDCVVNTVLVHLWGIVVD